MATYIFNKKTGQWEKNMSMLASAMKVTDLNENFKSEDKNVERCLEELKEDLTQVEKDIKYIYENGTIGGGGGGGSSLPKLTLEGSENMICSIDDEIDIYYFFQSPNVGSGKAYYSINNGENTIVDSKQGRNKISLGKLSVGTYTFKLHVIDTAGLFSNIIVVEVRVGSLTLTSTFDETNSGNDFNLGQTLSIEYSISTWDSSDPIKVTLTKDNKSVQVDGVVGRNVWNLGVLDREGVHNMSIVAKNSLMTSNILRYSIMALSPNSIFQSSNFSTTEIDYGKPIVIDYRIAMSNHDKFKSYHYINGELIDVADTGKSNFWNVGKLSVGNYILEIVSETITEPILRSNTLRFELEVLSNGLIMTPDIKDALLFSFNANGKNNNGMNRGVWEDLSGNNVNCTLYGFNFGTNGWLNDSLVFNGKSYAIIDFEPLKTNYLEGFTFDILYKVENVGNIEAKVVDCRRKDAPYNGFYIGIEKSSIRSQSSTEADVKFPERTFIKKTFVIDRTKRLLKVYINGTIASTRYITADEMFTYNQKLYLGAELINGEVTNYANCSISKIRGYRKTLSDTEILQNYIADIDDLEEQIVVREQNCLRLEGNLLVPHNNLSIPTLTMYGDISRMDNVNPASMRLVYIDPDNPTNSFEKEGCLVSWQGTSSLQYPVKNYTIKLRDGGNEWFFAPRENWIGESRYTLKADFMESSHANNIGTANFYQDLLTKYLASNPKIENLPTATPQMADIKQGTRNCIDGFPIKLVIVDTTNNIAEDKGIYNFNLDRYSHRNYGLYDERKAVSYEIGVNSEDGAGAFMDDSWESIRTDFRYRYHYAGNEEAVTDPPNEMGERLLTKDKHKELEDLVSWVKNCPQELFSAQFTEHFDAHYTIIYFLIVYSFGIIDNLGKNMVLTTWGRDEQTENTIWIPQFYDLDSMLGLDNEGRMKYEPDVDMASGHFNTSHSLLWKKIVNDPVLSKCVSDIYTKLRFELKLLTAENFLKFYTERAIDRVGARFYNEDIDAKYIKYTADGADKNQYIYMCNGSRIESTKRWLEERFLYMDSVYGSVENSKSVIFRANEANGQVSLRIKTYSPVWVTVSFSDQLGNKSKKLCNRGEWTEFTGNVTSGTDNNIHITSAKNLMYVDGVKRLNVSSALIGEAERLVELDVSGSDYLRGVYLGNNRFMQRLILNDCTKLGLATVDNTLDLQNCVNLKELNCSNTLIANILVNSNGGNLETLACDNTKITALSLSGQEYFENLSVSGCSDLSYVNLRDCKNIVNVNLSDSNIIELNVLGCGRLNSVDVSRTSRLELLNLSGCSELTTLLSSNSIVLRDINISGTKISNLDINNCNLLEKIDVRSTLLTSIDVTNNPALLELYLGNSRINSILIANENLIEMLDITNLTLGSIDSTKLKNLKYLNMYNSSVSGIDFTKMSKLESINIVGSTLGTLDLSNCPNMVSMILSENNKPNKLLETLNISNSNISSLDLHEEGNTKCTNLKFLVADNTRNLKKLKANEGILSVSLTDSAILVNVWTFYPIYPDPLLSVNNMANYNVVMVNGTRLSNTDVTKLKDGELEIFEDSYIEIFDGILAGTTFFMDSEVAEIPSGGIEINKLFMDELLAEHIRELTGKASVYDKVTQTNLDSITWIGREPQFIEPSDYLGYFNRLRVKSFNGIDFLTKLKYINLAGCWYEGSLKFKLNELESLDFAFADMPYLTSVVFEGDMSKVKSISYMCKDDRSIQGVIIPNAINIENASYAFLNCVGINHIVAEFDNDKIKYINGVFKGCNNIESLTLRPINSTLLEWNEAFSGCIFDSVSFMNDSSVRKMSDITLIHDLLPITKKLDMSLLPNLEEVDLEGENSVVEELNLDNTKLSALDITGEYDWGEIIKVVPDKRFVWGLQASKLNGKWRLVCKSLYKDKYPVGWEDLNYIDEKNGNSIFFNEGIDASNELAGIIEAGTGRIYLNKGYSNIWNRVSRGYSNKLTVSSTGSYEHVILVHTDLTSISWVNRRIGTYESGINLEPSTEYHFIIEFLEGTEQYVSSLFSNGLTRADGKDTTIPVDSTVMNTSFVTTSGNPNNEWAMSIIVKADTPVGTEIKFRTQAVKSNVYLPMITNTVPNSQMRIRCDWGSNTHSFVAKGFCGTGDLARSMWQWDWDKERVESWSDVPTDFGFSKSSKFGDISLQEKGNYTNRNSLFIGQSANPINYIEKLFIYSGDLTEQEMRDDLDKDIDLNEFLYDMSIEGFK